MGLITDLFKNVIVAKQVYNLITFSAAFIVFLIIFIVVGLPWFIILGFIAIGLIFVALSIFQIKRTLSVNLEEKPIPPESSITKSSLKGEKVLASIFGIINFNFFLIFSASFSYFTFIVLPIGISITR